VIINVLLFFFIRSIILPELLHVEAQFRKELDVSSFALRKPEKEQAKKNYGLN